MPRLTIEHQTKVAHGIYECTEKTYIIPDSITFKGVVLDYNIYSGCYENKLARLSISGEDYLNKKLNAEKDYKRERTL